MANQPFDYVARELARRGVTVGGPVKTNKYGPFDEAGAEAYSSWAPMKTAVWDFPAGGGTTAFVTGGGLTITSLNTPTTPQSGVVNGVALVNPGTAADTGIKLAVTGALQEVNTASTLSHVPVYSLLAASAPKNLTYITQYRFMCQSGAATWDGKFFLGLGAPADNATAAMTFTTGAIDDATNIELAGLHVGESGVARLITKTSTNALVNARTLTDWTFINGGSTGVLANQSAIDWSTTARKNAWRTLGIVARWDSAGALLPFEFWWQGVKVATSAASAFSAAEGMLPVVEVQNGPSQVCDLFIESIVTAISRPSCLL